MLKRLFWICIAATGLISAGLLFSLPTPAVTEYKLIIRKVSIWRNGEFTAAKDIGINNGKIVAIEESIAKTATNEIDGSDKFLLPALVDAHTHTFGQGLRDAIRFGVGTHLDMFTDQRGLSELLEPRSQLSNTNKADLFSAGMLATAPKGHGTQFGSPIDTLTSPDQASEWVRKRKAEGSDFIKLVYMPESTFFQSIDLATARAVIEAAQQSDLKVVAHISSLAAARDMLEAGIDGLVHQFADQSVDEAFLSLAKANGMFMIPTLSVIASVDRQTHVESLAAHKHVGPHLSAEQTSQLNASFGSHSIPGFDYAIAAANTLAMHRAGIPIMAGSDAPNPGTTYGASLHQELQLLVKAGLPNKAALAAATSLPNQHFDIETRGTIEIGAPASLVMLNSSPLENIQNTLDINSIFKNGTLANRDTGVVSKATSEGKKLASPKLSNFDQGLDVSNVLRWMATDDRIRQGTSNAVIELSEGALKVNTTVTSNVVFPWAGASVFSQQPLDFSEYQSVSFKVRGTPGTYTLMGFSGSLDKMPTMQSFEVKDDWQDVTLTFDKFSGFEVSQFLGFAFVTTKADQTAEFVLAEVQLNY